MGIMVTERFAIKYLTRLNSEEFWENEDHEMKFWGYANGACHLHKLLPKGCVRCEMCQNNSCISYLYDKIVAGLK